MSGSERQNDFAGSNDVNGDWAHIGADGHATNLRSASLFPPACRMESETKYNRNRAGNFSRNPTRNISGKKRVSKWTKNDAYVFDPCVELPARTSGTADAPGSLEIPIPLLARFFPLPRLIRSPAIKNKLLRDVVDSRRLSRIVSPTPSPSSRS